MKKYTVKELSSLAKVSIRTLHYYDEIDLLNPCSRSESGYRYYGDNELFRLQQILFFKELQIPLEKIKEIINAPNFDLISALKSHRKQILERSKQFKLLIQTIDRTLDKLNHKTTMSDEQLYEGFSSPEEGRIFAEEAEERWGETVRESNERIRQMSPEEFKKLKLEGDSINKELSLLMGLAPESKEVQYLISRHYEHISNYWHPNKRQYLELGKMYVEDERFKAYYDNYKVGLAEFICEAIRVFCSN